MAPRLAQIATLLATVSLAVGCAPPDSDGGTAEPISLRLLQANIGNANLGCQDYAFNLCFIDVEAQLADKVADLDPDVLVLQEVVAADQCDGILEDDPTRVCHPDHIAAEPLQLARLLGPDYETRCDGRAGFECFALKKGKASFAGDTLTPPFPSECTQSFSVVGVDVKVDGAAPFRLVNGHPQSGWGSADYACRTEEIALIFDGEDALAAGGDTLIAGDMNLDPFVHADSSAAKWLEHVGTKRADLRFRYHSGPTEHDPPYPSISTPLGDNVLDHVVSDFAEGTCTTLGGAPGTETLVDGASLDHRGLLCELDLPAAEQ